MAGKMHELLAAETNVKTFYNAMLSETMKVFGTGAHFVKQVETLTHFNAEESRLDTVKTKDIVTTVDERLGYFFGRPFVNMLDLMIQKDATNQTSKADLVVEGQTILSGVPAVTLLSWEGHFDALRAVLLAIPHLQAGPEWVRDDAENLWRTKEAMVSFNTRKTAIPVVLYEATKEHPAQVKEVFEDKAIAKKEVTTWSGMWTSKQKADALARLDALLVAIKKARQRANRAPVVQVQAGAILANFILKGPEADKLTGADTPSDD